MEATLPQDIPHLAGAALFAAMLGYLLCWGLERLLRQVIADRFAAIALSCAIAFILLMAGTSLYLTRTLPEHFARAIVLPPIGYALAFILGLALVGAIRVYLYGKEYQEGDEQLVFEPDYNDHSRYDEEVIAFDDRNAGRNYLARHWAGHLSLPLSYWVNGALLSGLILAGTRAVTERIESGSGSLQSLAIVILAYLGISTIFWVWSSVGIWRSAYWHRRRGGSPGWGLAARSLVVLTLCVTLYRSGDIARQVAEFGQLAAGRDSIGAVAEMKVSKNGREIVLDGHIAAGAAEKFAAVLKAGPRVTTIVLTSPGGRILEAERIAAMIRQRRLDTEVDDICMSACTNILLAGRERTAEETARIGFHAPSFPGFTAGEMRAGVARMREAYLAAGVDPAFVYRALSTPAEKMWLPSYYELETAGVLTGAQLVVRAGGRPAPALDRAGIAREFQGAAAQMNGSAPTRVDELTTFDSASASGLTLTRNYTVAIDAAQMKAGRLAMVDILRKQSCDRPQLAAMIREGARFVHVYRGRRGELLFEIEIASCPKA